MVINIDDFKKDFIEAPKELIEKPQTNEDYLSNLYYKLSSLFHNFSRNDILDMFKPESFYYDKDLNLFASIHVDNLNFIERNLSHGTKWSTPEFKGELVLPKLNYWFAKDKFLLTLDNSLSFNNDYKIVKPFNYDLEFYLDQCNYKWFYDWNELRPKTDALIAHAKEVLDTHKFFYIDTFNSLEECKKTHKIWSFNILESYEIIGNLYIKVNHKRFDCNTNELDYRRGFWSKNYDFDETISFAQLLKRPDFIQGFDEDFVKECVAYYAKSKVQEDINKLDGDIKHDINKLESEITKLQTQLDKNKNKVKKLQTKKNAIKASDFTLNLEIPKKKDNGKD